MDGLQMLNRPKQKALDFALEKLAWRKPQWLWSRLFARARRLGFDRNFLILSFDCDTSEDAKVVLEMDEKLRALGARPVYAVPGELLKRHWEDYRGLVDRGAEFINHGYREHTFWNDEKGRYESCFFYDRQSVDDVLSDIRQGDECLRELGIQARGFRTPHFGTFQKPEHFKLLYKTIRELGYSFSSSAVPRQSYLRGPVYEDGGVLEIPVSGIFSKPLEIQDTWAFFEAPDRQYRPEDYLKEAQARAQDCAQHSVGLLNFYADPSHIWDESAFFEAVKCWTEVATPITFSELKERV